jgi:hypothetical protein
LKNRRGMVPELADEQQGQRVNSEGELLSY